MKSEMRGKQNRFVSFFIGLLSVIMLTLCCFTLNIGSVRAKAINYTEVDISDTLTAANWGTTMGRTVISFMSRRRTA